MKPEAQRIAIAEACGWKDVQISTINPNQVSGWLPPNGDKHNRKFVPDYLNDLNAMHEAEKVLGEFGGERWAIYEKFIRGGRGVNFSGELTHATAAQRAEAFLRTLSDIETSESQERIA